MADHVASAKQANVKTSPKPITSRLNYISETISELKKVVWLTRQETVYLTVLVIIVAITMGVLLGALDYGFAGLIDKVIMGK